MPTIKKIVAWTAFAFAVCFPETVHAEEAVHGLSATLSNLSNSTNVLFILIGGFMILFMHGGFAFLEVGSVRKKKIK